MSKLSNILLPTLVGITVYIIVSKLFPEKLADTEFKNDYRGGSLLNKDEIFKELFRKIMNDRALKVAIMSIFLTAGVRHFHQEIEKLLTNSIFPKVCDNSVKGELKTVCDIIKEHKLPLHTKTLNELIVNNNLSNSNKINLLKIKLDFIINGECGSKKRFFLVSIIAALISVSVSGVGGLSLFLEALYRLFQEGKISQALYQQILETLKNK